MNELLFDFNPFRFSMFRTFILYFVSIKNYSFVSLARRESVQEWVNFEYELGNRFFHLQPTVSCPD